jgi:membrane-associated phospholipid phosphatase
MAIAVSLALLSPALCAQAPSSGDVPLPDPAAKPKPKPPARELRLSDWLLQQPAPPDAYPLGLSLRLREEVPSQTGLKLELVSALAGDDKSVRADPAAVQRLRVWISGLPVTGRVTVASADGRWLQTNPAHNPVLTPGYSVDLPRRPRTVTVVTSSGNRCSVTHESGREAQAYVDACRPADGSGSDWAWIAQPDGRVQRFGIALWNKEKQDEPAPGAWIWAPGRRSGWPDAFSKPLIHFLATQGPAPDPGESAQPRPSSGGRAGGDIAATDPRSPDASGAPTAEGMILRGGMSLGLSDAFLAQHAPDSPPTVPGRPDPLILRTEERAPRSRSVEVSSSDWGTVGLLQTPTARMRDPGYLSFHYSRVQPYSHGNVIFQPFDWMEAGFRYTDVSNRLYGPAELSGDQTYKDKSIDVKFRAWKESAYLPEVAVGLRDIGGTGLFAGEYVVANKRTGDFDWSLGLGWGYVGARGNLRNPFSVIDSAFDSRTGATGQGGDFSLTRYFRGPTALFGGVQYQTPWQPLTLKLEYDGNDYQHEPQANNQPQSSPFNFGVVYRAWKGVDLMLGFERGNTVMFGVTLHTDLSRLTQPKISDPAPVPVLATRPARAPDWSATARDFSRQTDWKVRAIEQRENDVRVVVEDAGAVYWKDRVDRAAAVLHRDAPAGVEKFTLRYRGVGMDVAEHVVDREAWVAQRTQAVPPSAQRETVIARPAEEGLRGDVVHAGEKPKVFEHGLRLSYAQTLGGPDAFVLWQLGLVESARLRLRDDTWVQGSVRLRVADNYDKFRYTGPSNLPRVRTFLREYLTTSTLTIPNLQLTHVGKVGENHFYSAYGGLLEEMYGGVGGEWLYRPFASRLAVGVDVNAVRQREFEQHFGFRDYDVLTGHGSLYWDTGWNDVLATLSVGRYLAKDIGATLNVSRIFRNGVTIGAFATKTNVSAEEFGEGSFDKGIYISVPFDALFTRSSRSFMGTTWKPLTRDGGAMLARSVQLYALTGSRGDRTLWTQPAPLPNEMLKATDQRVEYESKAPTIEPYTRVTPKTPSAKWEQLDSIEAHRVASSLYAQDFRNIKVTYEPTQRVLITASTDSLRPIGRAAGRAARTALLQAPLEARGIEVTLVDGVTPQVRYEFFELDRLRRYFNGALGIEALKPYVKIEWLTPAARVRDPFERFDDLDPAPNPSILATLVPDTLSAGRIANDFIGAGVAATKTDWLGAAAIGAGAVLTASFFDDRAYRYAQDHVSSRWLTNGVRIGNAIPFVGFAAAGALALDGSDPRRSRTGYAAVEAGATAFAVATGLKYVVGRARPTTALGKKEFNWLTRDDAYASFPSRHTMAAWAIATPFALEYDMPWLYGVAALTNLSRIGSREHWVSDTVASSLIGYGIGRLFWQSGREQAKGEPRVYFDGSTLGLNWGW